jgi:DNA-binding FadR family transcriptional regulator
MGAVIRVALESAFSYLPATDQRSTVVHRAVLDAIRLRDQAGADRAMRRLVD